MNIKRLGAIDIGSNSVKLLVSDMISCDGRVINKKFIYTQMPLQLGNDTFNSGSIGQVKIEQLARLICTFKSFIEISEAEDYRICATSALREASNKKDILDFIHKATGEHIEIVPPMDEANFMFLSGIQENCDTETLYVIVDIGGGCTDIALCYENILIESKSFHLGTIRNLSHGNGVKEWRNMNKWLIEKRSRYRKVCLIGSGGNINKIKSLHKRGTIRRIDLRNFYNNMASLSEEKRLLKSDLNLNRIEEILSAIRIYTSIMKVLKIEYIQIPMIGIVDGIIRDLYLKNKH